MAAILFSGLLLLLLLQPSVVSGITVKVDIQKGSSSPSSHKSFSPSKITVDKGTTIRWINKDVTLHTVTSGKSTSGNSGIQFDSSYLAADQTFEHTFEKAGTYDYYCTLHPFMKGKVIVSTHVGAIKTAEKQPPIQLDTTPNTNINVTRWSNFTDADHRFLVQYPSHWLITQSGNRFTEELPLVAVDTNGSTLKIQSQLSVNVFKKNQNFGNNQLAKFTENQLVNQIAGNKLVEPVSCAKYQINGSKACSLVYAGDDKKGKRYGILAIVVVDKSGWNHVISYRADPTNFDNELTTIKHIISSYKLLNNVSAK